MRFAMVLFCWAAYFGWDLAANCGELVQAIGIKIVHLMHMTGLV
jgi:hypothetical protein